jgi:FAD/FMN-containing dehydrogenase
MRGVRIDPIARTARVRAGALWIEVTRPASTYGLAPLAGSSPDVGVVGYTLGGGLSWLGRKHGLAANSVIAIELVTADGAHRRVDVERDPELFWAIRGGGGAFGVVTAIEFRLYEVPALYGGPMFWPWERSAEVLHAWREWTATAPDEVTSSARILQLPPLETIPEPLRGRAFVNIDAAVLASEDEAREILRPLLELEPEIAMLGAMEPVALSRLHNDPEEPMPGISEARVLRELPPEAVDALVAAAGPGSASVALATEIRHLGGALGRPAVGGGALDRFAGEYLFFTVTPLMDPALRGPLSAGLAAIRRVVEPWGAEANYLNFEEHPAGAETLFDGETYDRLRAVKRLVDPDDVIRSNHPIPPAA